MIGLRPEVPRPDFLRPIRRAQGWAWVWLATAMAALCFSVADAVQAHQDRTRAAERLQARQQPGPDRITASADARPVDGDPESRQWLQRLRHPWPAVFVATEQAAEDGLAWLSWQHDIAGRLQIEGVAPDPAAVLAAVARLQGQGGGSSGAARPHTAALLQDLLLTRMEPVDGGWRFTLQARLGPPSAGGGAAEGAHVPAIARSSIPAAPITPTPSDTPTAAMPRRPS